MRRFSKLRTVLLLILRLLRSTISDVSKVGSSMTSKLFHKEPRCLPVQLPHQVLYPEPHPAGSTAHAPALSCR